MKDILLGLFLIASIHSGAQTDPPENNMELRTMLAQEMIKSQQKVDSTYTTALDLLKQSERRVRNLKHENAAGQDSLLLHDLKTYGQYLRNSQEAWEAYQETNCLMRQFKSRFAAQGGWAFYQECMTEHYQKRNKELEEVINYIRLEFATD